MTTVALVQARMGSTRLPGKVLRPLAGRPALAWVLDRVGRIPGLDAVAVVTSGLDRDDPVARFAAAHGARVVRGAELDVLDRYRTAAHVLGADVVVRITADCPLVDPAVVGRLVAHRAAARLDHAAVATGALPADAGRRRHPDGLDAEAVLATALEAAWLEARDPYEREHVTPFLYRRPGRFACDLLEAPRDLGEHRWTLDRPDDLAFLDAVLTALGERGAEAGYEEIAGLVAADPVLRALAPPPTT
jgi:spore coat polysaccharide biosynthesis protein SpsF